MVLTLPIREVVPATPRARVVRIDLRGERFPYLPGQAVLLASHGRRPRPYSIAAAPEDTAREGCLELLVGVNAEGSAGPHLVLTPGSDVDIEGPLGRFTFPDQPSERRFVFIAGGTGIAPLRAMMRHALHLPHGQIGLLYSARTPAEFAYEEELRALARDGRIELKQTVTREVGTGELDGAAGQNWARRPRAARPRSRDSVFRVRTAGARGRGPEAARGTGRAAQPDQDRGVGVRGPSQGRTYRPTMWYPASTISTSPVIARPLAALRRNVAAAATSPSSMLRLSGVRSL